MLEGNDVRISNGSSSDDTDPVVDNFLSFVADDMSEHPERLLAIPKSLVKRAQEVAAGIAIDHEETITGLTAL